MDDAAITTTNHQPTKRMNYKFDELTRSMAQSVTRRGALRKFSVGLAGMVLACLGLANKAEAGKRGKYNAPCVADADCMSGYCREDGRCGCVSQKDCGNGHHDRGYCESGWCWNWF